MPTITPIVPASSPFWDGVRRTVPGAVIDDQPDWIVPDGNFQPNSINSLVNILTNELNLRLVVYQYTSGTGATEETDPEYDRYLEFPTRPGSKLSYTAMQIIEDAGAETDEEKIYAIEQWVIKHIKYVSDNQTRGVNEYWEMPSTTLERKSGDCEDGAFLLHSLALHAGIPAERLRTYGGPVDDKKGNAGGHAWTAFRRDDGEWVAVDWCYWPTDTKISERDPLRLDDKYVGAWFFIREGETVETDGINDINPVRHPDLYKGMFLDLRESRTSVGKSPPIYSGYRSVYRTSEPSSVNIAA